MPEDKPREATLETVLAATNLRAAWRAVKANRGAPGVDRMDMEQSARHLREHWDVIGAKLLDGSYKPGAVRVVSIPKANGGERQLGIPNITDRVIQQAIHQVLARYGNRSSAPTATGSGPDAVPTTRCKPRKHSSKPGRPGWWTSI